MRQIKSSQVNHQPDPRPCVDGCWLYCMMYAVYIIIPVYYCAIVYTVLYLLNTSREWREERGEMIEVQRSIQLSMAANCSVGGCGRNRNQKLQRTSAVTGALAHRCWCACQCFRTAARQAERIARERKMPNGQGQRISRGQMLRGEPVQGVGRCAGASGWNGASSAYPYSRYYTYAELYWIHW